MSITISFWFLLLRMRSITTANCHSFWPRCPLIEIGLTTADTWRQAVWNKRGRNISADIFHGGQTSTSTATVGFDWTGRRVHWSIDCGALRSPYWRSFIASERIHAALVRQGHSTARPPPGHSAPKRACGILVFCATPTPTLGVIVWHNKCVLKDDFREFF